MQAGSVRAAGTSTLRRIHEESKFMSAAEAALGHPYDVISGREEARLIYGGVVSSLPPNDGIRLVMDIGGGSTELILGDWSQAEGIGKSASGLRLDDGALLQGRQADRGQIQAGSAACPARVTPGQSLFSWQ